MLFYTLNNLLLLFWSWLFCIRKPQLLLVMTLRNQIGFDYNMYAIGFNQMCEEGFTSLTYKDWEIGFVVMTKLLGMFLPNYIWYLAFLSIFAVIPAAVFIGRHSEMPWLSTILYINVFLYFMEMNFLRQMIAVSLVMLSWEFIKRNKFIGFAVSIANPDRFQKFVGIGITSQIGYQMILNIMVVTNMVPNTGISLPFFSSGGTSLTMLLAEIGVLLAISRSSPNKIT